MIKVQLLADNPDSVEVQPDVALLEIITDGRLAIPLGCVAAKCGVCLVEEIDGTLAPPSKLESAALEGFGCQSGQRLACQARVDKDVTLCASVR